MFCNNVINVTSITSSGGITTVTIPVGTTFTACKSYTLAINVVVPAGTNGTQINVTDGTTTYTIFNRCANYWRPCYGLRTRSCLRLKYLNDPAHFILDK
jgi:hypothetical protein